MVYWSYGAEDHYNQGYSREDWSIEKYSFQGPV